MVHLTTDILPKNKPRYLMGVGFAIDLVVCSALGIDMFDCVYPTRTAVITSVTFVRIKFTRFTGTNKINVIAKLFYFQRFGCALVHKGQLNLKQVQYRKDMNPIDQTCECSTCKTYTRAYLHHIVTVETVACHLLSVHNIAFQMKLMKDIRQSIKEQTFPGFVQQFVLDVYPNKEYPSWIVNALEAVNIKLL